jgi:hypothetical protein
MENGGQRSRTGGLSVSLAGPDGRLLGGGVAGLLIAASPIQVLPPPPSPPAVIIGNNASSLQFSLHYLYF